MGGKERKKKGGVTFAGIINNQQPAVETRKETPPMLKVIGGTDGEEEQLTLNGPRRGCLPIS